MNNIKDNVNLSFLNEKAEQSSRKKIENSDDFSEILSDVNSNKEGEDKLEKGKSFTESGNKMPEGKNLNKKDSSKNDQSEDKNDYQDHKLEGKETTSKKNIVKLNENFEIITEDAKIDDDDLKEYAFSEGMLEEDLEKINFLTKKNEPEFSPLISNLDLSNKLKNEFSAAHNKSNLEEVSLKQKNMGFEINHKLLNNHLKTNNLKVNLNKKNGESKQQQINSIKSGNYERNQEKLVSIRDINFTATENVDSRKQLNDKNNIFSARNLNTEEIDLSRELEPIIKKALLGKTSAKILGEINGSVDKNKIDINVENIMKFDEIDKLDETILLTEDQINTSELLKKNEQFQLLSQKAAEAISSRIIAQIAKGKWELEIAMRPQLLGKIDVQLKMVDGEMEAFFKSSNLVTRELIAEGFPRLKEFLENSGINVSNLQLGENRNKGTSDFTKNDDASKTSGEQDQDSQKDYVNEVENSIAKISEDNVDVTV